jgi:hypothetical protein
MHYDDDTVELYNLARDPIDECDLAPEQPELAEQLVVSLREWLTDVGAHLPRRLDGRQRNSSANAKHTRRKRRG